MRKFGDFSELSENNVQAIEKIINGIESKGLSCSLFYGFPLIELDNSSTIMKGCIISTKGVLILHSLNDEKMVYWRHINKTIMECPTISELAIDPSVGLISFKNLDEIESIIDYLETKEDIMSKKDVDLLVAVIQKAYNLSKFDNRQINKPESIGSVIKERNNKVNVLDEEQFETIYKSQIGHARIRGLAGSGKTILLVKKMAYLHYRNPDLNIAYVFYTVSLKQFIEKLFRLYYKEFDAYKEPDMSKVSILHSWGSRNTDGFYSTICKNFNIERKTFRDVYGEADKLGAVCNNLLEQLNNQDVGLYDYVFIDEAQDFTLPFYKLALKSLKPTGKLVYAYDELQSLNTDNKMPSKYSIFGRKKCEDINLSVCYRTPKEILVTAHALGLGVYKKNDDGTPNIVNMIQDLDTWEAIGYEVEDGKLALGQDVVLSRKDVISDKCQDSVVILDSNSVEEQYTYVSNEILNLIQNEDVSPDDIMIIDLDSINLNDNFTLFKKVLMSKAWDESNSKWICGVNLVNKDNAIKFRIKDSIPYTTIFRAKGNEANIVFVINAHKLQSISSYSRNRIFTAMTRARFKVYLLGVGDMQSFVQEAQTVKENDYKLKFKYPTKNELQKMSTIAKTEIKSAKDYESLIDSIKLLKANPKLLKEALLEELGAGSLEEAIDILKGIDDKDE